MDSPLDQVLELGAGLEADIAGAPARFVAWTCPQWEFKRSNARRKLFRAGNQALGKSWAGLSEVDDRCLGRGHGFPVHVPPIEAWVVCVVWSQSVKIQKKFNELCTASEIDWGRTPAFDEKNGFGAKNPTVVYKNGSIVVFKTTNQGGLNLASATLHHVLIDELTTPRIFGELAKRLTRTGGTLALTLTPINAPADWLAKLCKQGIVQDFHYRLEPEHMFPVVGWWRVTEDGQEEERHCLEPPGPEWEPLVADKPLYTAAGKPMDAEWIAEIRAGTDPVEAPVVLDGEWETREGGRRLPAYIDRHRSEGGQLVTWSDLPDEFDEVRLGLDHGTGVGRQMVYVSGVVYGPKRITPYKGAEIWHLREWANETEHPMPAEIAGHVVRLLEELGLTVYDIARAIGDINVAGMTGGGAKYNRFIEQAIADVLGAKVPPLELEEARKKRGSPKAGEAAMNHAMAEGRFFVHEDCMAFRTAAQRYRGGAREEWKNAIDGGRYGVQDILLAAGISGRPVVQRG